MASGFWRNILDRRGILAAAALTCALSSSHAAERTEVISAELDREPIKIARIDSENWEIGPYAGILSIEDFDSSEWYGLRIAYHVSERIFFEASWGDGTGDTTSFEDLSGGAKLFSDEDREYTSYDLSLGINVFPGEAWLFGHAFASNFYLILGAGSTEFGGDKWFTVNAGAGYRLFLTDWLAWRLDARDHWFNRDLFGEDDRTHNIELVSGFTFFF